MFIFLFIYFGTLEFFLNEGNFFSFLKVIDFSKIDIFKILNSGNKFGVARIEPGSILELAVCQLEQQLHDRLKIQI